MTPPLLGDLGMIVLTVLVPGFVFYVRSRTLRRLQAMMMTKSVDAGPDVSPTTLLKQSNQGVLDLLIAAATPRPVAPSLPLA